jgi:hypothetical protein
VGAANMVCRCSDLLDPPPTPLTRVASLWLHRWILQLLVGTIKLHAFIRYQQAGGHQTIDFFLFILVYTLMVVLSLVAFIQRDNFPRHC